MTVERDWFWFWFWFYYALWLASVFTLVLVLRQSSENRSIGAKPFRKNKILHSDQFSLGPGSAVGEKLKREKIGELSGSLGTREKGPRDLFMPFHTIFSPQQSLVRVRSALINNSCAAGSQQTSLP